jgi:hypothetical protein
LSATGQRGERGAGGAGVRNLTTWIILAPAIGLLFLGVLFIVRPRLGAALFGMPAPEGAGPAYLAAIGIRDLAFGLYIAALGLFATRRAVGLVLAITVLIPVGDILILFAERGLAAGVHLLLHGVSGLYMAGAALWVLRGPRAADEPRGTPT